MQARRADPIVIFRATLLAMEARRIILPGIWNQYVCLAAA
jgi:hypothetical protein